MAAGASVAAAGLANRHQQRVDRGAAHAQHLGTYLGLQARVAVVVERLYQQRFETHAAELITRLTQRRQNAVQQLTDYQFNDAICSHM